MKWREKWLLYRSMGKRDGNGNFEPPISFLEALRLPKAMIDVFQTLDSTYGKMELQWLDKMKKSDPKAEK